MKIIVLGAGLVGTPMAVDLAKNGNYQVSVADINSETLKKIETKYPISTIKKDLSKPSNIKSIIGDYDLVINALPGFLGFQALKSIIEERKNVVDIAFYPEDPFELDNLAKKNKVIAVVDCGVSPGMSNILIGYVNEILDKTEKALILVGGLPQKRVWPYEYKAVFSPLDVIEEYTRPARYKEKRELVVKPALSDVELIDFERIGTLEAFNSDGLRTLLKTVDIPNIKEKTLRYPGHVEKIKILRETGFFSQDKIDINGVKIRPLNLTAKLLIPKWKLEEGERDFTIMRVIVEGKKEGKKVKYTYDLYDEYDEKTKIHSMARVTGYTATVVAEMILNGMYKKIGISPPEYIGKTPDLLAFILERLKNKGVIYQQKIEKES